MVRVTVMTAVTAVRIAVRGTTLVARVTNMAGMGPFAASVAAMTSVTAMAPMRSKSILNPHCDSQYYHQRSNHQHLAFWYACFFIKQEIHDRVLLNAIFL